MNCWKTINVNVDFGTFFNSRFVLEFCSIQRIAFFQERLSAQPEIQVTQQPKESKGFVSSLRQFLAKRLSLKKVCLTLICHLKWLMFWKFWLYLVAFIVFWLYQNTLFLMQQETNPQPSYPPTPPPSDIIDKGSSIHAALPYQSCLCILFLPELLLDTFQIVLQSSLVVSNSTQLDLKILLCVM